MTLISHKIYTNINRCNNEAQHVQLHLEIQKREKKTCNNIYYLGIMYFLSFQAVQFEMRYIFLFAYFTVSEANSCCLIHLIESYIYVYCSFERETFKFM